MKRIVPIALVAACGGGAAPDGPDGGDDPPGEHRVDHAGFVHLIEGTSSWGSGAYAAFYDGAFEQPAPAIVASAGDCAAHHRPDDGGTPASPRSAGEITITGLTAPATLTPSDYGYVSPTLPEDVFSDAAAIHIAAAGDDIPAFTADLTGVAPLESTADLVELRDGEDETITWTPVDTAAGIQLALYLGWHGAPWTDLLLCETSDDGSLTIPAALVAAMPYFEGGLFQWPSWLSRFRRTWHDAPTGPIELLVASQHGLYLAHAP